MYNLMISYKLIKIMFVWYEVNTIPLFSVLSRPDPEANGNFVIGRSYGTLGFLVDFLWTFVK